MVFSRRPWLAPLLSSFFFAVMAVAVKALTSVTIWGDYRLPTGEVVFFRSLIPTLLMLPLAWRERGAFAGHLPAGFGRQLLGRGVAGACAMICYFLALNYAPTPIAVLSGNTSPLWTFVFAAYRLGEPAPRNLGWALPLALLGCAGVCLAQPESFGSAESLWLGAALGLFSAMCSGYAYTYVRQLRELPASWVTLSLTATATLFVLPWMGHWAWPSSSAWVWIGVMGLSSGLAQWFMTIGFQHNSAALASTLGLGAVFFSALLGGLLLEEHLGALQWLGVAGVVIGVLAVVRG